MPDRQFFATNLKQVSKLRYEIANYLEEMKVILGNIK